MFEFGPHSGFIWMSYIIVTAVLLGLIVWIISDGRKQRRSLAQLEQKGVSRRKAANQNEDEID
jgi:heme exporter protein D